MSTSSNLLPFDHRRVTPAVLTSPLAVTMLLHYYAIVAPFMDVPVEHLPPAQTRIYNYFMEEGLIEVKRNSVHTTEKGDALVAAVMENFKHATNEIVHSKISR